MSEVVQVRRKVAGIVLAFVLAGGALFGIGIKSWTGHSVLGAENVPVAVAKEVGPVSLGNFANGFSAVIRPALPAVVNISSSKVVKTPGMNGGSPFFNDPFFRQFFGDQFGETRPQKQRERSLGSGVIINSNGYILTNNHVVDGASDVKVFLNDKREFQAKIIGTDPKTDIAVLKIDAHNLPALTLGDSSKLQVGDVVFAIGDPFNVGETATMGIVSATGRGGLDIERGGYEDFIQTDASINPGNSGGALLDVHGNLIGINTAILTGGGGGNQGIGFAIPINMAHQVMDQIVAHGKVIRGYLGIYPQDLTPELAKAFGLNQGGGALVADVTPDSPAAKAGLKKGDVILNLNGKPLEDSNQLRNRISQTAPGTPVDLTVFRNGKTSEVRVTLAELPEKAEKTGPGETSSAALEGVEVQDLTPDVAQQLELPAGTHGVVISSIEPSSPAAAVGLNRGDVIQEINHKPVRNTEDYREALASTGRQSVLLLVNRGGITRYVVVEPGK
ncbi:MAG: DegQ family serine endoprotease [Candidatus Acidiferrales bacterium]